MCLNSHTETHTNFLLYFLNLSDIMSFPFSGMIMVETRIMEVMILVMEEVEVPVTPPLSPGVTLTSTSCSHTMLSLSRPGEGAVWSFHNADV